MLEAEGATYGQGVDEAALSVYLPVTFPPLMLLVVEMGDAVDEGGGSPPCLAP